MQHSIPVNHFLEVPAPTYDGNKWHNNGKNDLPTPPAGYVWFIYYSNGRYWAIEIPDNATITVGPNGQLTISWTDQNGQTHSYTLPQTNCMFIGQDEFGNDMRLYNFPTGTVIDIYRVRDGRGVLSVEPGVGNPTGLSRLLLPPYGSTGSGPGSHGINQNPCPQVPCNWNSGPAAPGPSGGGADTGGGTTGGHSGHSGGSGSSGGTSNSGGSGHTGGSGGGTSGGATGGSNSSGGTSCGASGIGGTTGGSSGSSGTGGGAGGSGGPCHVGDENMDCGEDENCDAPPVT